MRNIKTFICYLTIAAAVLFFSGCSDSGEDTGKIPADSPVLILGLDGLEWNFVLPMIREGRLPHMSKLMEQGYYGKLETFIPTFSPAVWTSIATGKGYRKHGIRSFFRRYWNGKRVLLQSIDRQTKALWNILSDYNRSTWCIGWWMTYPAEEINGVMVSQTNTMPKFDAPGGKHGRIWKGTVRKGVKGQVYPSELQDGVIDILEEVDRELPGLLKQIFPPFQYPLSPLGQRLWDNCRWAFRADTTYYRALLKLAKQSTLPDVTLLYFGGPDVVGHRFLRYKRPDIYKHKPSKEQIANFGTIIEDYYAYCDQVLGHLLEVYGSEVTIFIISDHGMEPVNLEEAFDPNDPEAANVSGGHKNKPPAVIIAAGPFIRKAAENKPLQSLTKQDLETVCSVLDITPTILAMRGIPVGKDMDGKVVRKIFNDAFLASYQPRTVITHDTTEFLATRRKRKRRTPHPAEKERLEQLRSLGYIGDSKGKK